MKVSPAPSSAALSCDSLRAIRALAGLTQSAMAQEIGLSLRAYQEIETGAAPIRALHIAAIERASLRLAIARQDLNIALPAVRLDAMAFASLLGGTLLTAG